MVCTERTGTNLLSVAQFVAAAAGASKQLRSEVRVPTQPSPRRAEFFKQAAQVRLFLSEQRTLVHAAAEGVQQQSQTQDRAPVLAVGDLASGQRVFRQRVRITVCQFLHAARSHAPHE